MGGGPYIRRIVDGELDEVLGQLAAVALEGAKGVGKTRTALERAKTVHRLDDPAVLEVARANPARLLDGERPVLVDEWQRTRVRIPSALLHPPRKAMRLSSPTAVGMLTPC